jgi:UDP-N-acetylglucosamine transferase subunit ALG13
LLKQNAEVIIAADKRPLELLKQEFPTLQFVTLKGYEINYPKSGSMALSMLFSIPKILKGIKREHIELENIVDKYAIDIVISDNRYGCWSKKVKSIFITHQLMIKSPFGEKLLHKKVLNYLKNYNECWVPDVSDSTFNFSGDLAHQFPLPDNTYFIGLLSRFNPPEQFEYTYDVMAIISGPEPQRGIFKYLLLQALQKTNLKSLIVCGETESDWEIELNDLVTIKSHLPSNEMRKAILNSKIIISRSGYSTIMDLAILNKKAIFIPTPGQTEQEYLAGMLMNKQMAISQNQTNIDIPKAIKESEKYSGLKMHGDNSILKSRIEFMLSSK